MGCGTSRAAVAPLAIDLEQQAHVQSQVTKALRQRQPASNSGLVWTNNTARNRKLAFECKDESVDTHAISNLASNASGNCSRNVIVSTASLSGSIASQELRKESEDKGGGSMCDKRSDESSGYESANWSVSQYERADVCERVTSTAGATNVRSPVEKQSAEYQVVRGGNEPVEFSVSPSDDTVCSRDPLYVRLALLTAALDGHLCGSKIHPDGSKAASGSMSIGMVEGGGEVRLGRSRSMRSLRFYHEMHSDHENVSRNPSVTKSVVKALVARTLSNYGVVDATSLDWEMLTDSVGPTVAGSVFQGTVDEGTVSNSDTDSQFVVRNSSPLTKHCPERDVGNELQWTNYADSPQTVTETFSPSLSPLRLGVTRGCSFSVEACMLGELSHDHTTKLSQLQHAEARVNRLSPSVSRKVSSISAVSSMQSRSVTSRDDLEELVERVSSALIASDQDGRRPSAVQMLVLQPAVVAASVTSEKKVRIHGLWFSNLSWCCAPVV